MSDVVMADSFPVCLGGCFSFRASLTVSGQQGFNLVAQTEWPIAVILGQSCELQLLFSSIINLTKI